jgi:hypothetical protein
MEFSKLPFAFPSAGNTCGCYSSLTLSKNIVKAHFSSRVFLLNFTYHMCCVDVKNASQSAEIIVIVVAQLT